MDERPAHEHKRKLTDSGLHYLIRTLSLPLLVTRSVSVPRMDRRRKGRDREQRTLFASSDKDTAMSLSLSSPTLELRKVEM